jgi:hypothetical protein
LIKYFQILHQEKVHYLQRLKTPQGKHKPHSEILFLRNITWLNSWRWLANCKSRTS